MGGTHGKTGPPGRVDAYEQDPGCIYSEGNLCRYCPFTRCFESLGRGERIKFGLAWKRDQAKGWRLNMWQVQRARAHSDELPTLLQLGWEPFAISRDGLVDNVWLKKNPAQQPEKPAAEESEEGRNATVKKGATKGARGAPKG